MTTIWKTMLSSTDILQSPMKEPGFPEINTVGDYLAQLLATLLSESESFSPKRPFGNSGWERDIFNAVVEAGHIDENFSSWKFNQVLSQAVLEHAFKA